jgi:two-component system, NarL family, nitrate/nitrite response regulator NarL
MAAETTIGEGGLRVFVVDNSPIHTQLLSDALKRNHDLAILPAVSDSNGVLSEIIASDIDVVVISSNLEEQPGRGIELLRELRVSAPGIRALILMDSSKREMIVDAFRAGARGIFSRRNSIEMLAKAIRCVHSGQIWANSHEMSLAVEALTSTHPLPPIERNSLKLLSRRELEVVEYLAQGMTNREIAERLQLSQHTVKNYLFKVFDKLGVSSRVELLFMTLSQPGAERFDFNGDPSKATELDENSFAVCKKAAEEGVLEAQLALAQMYASRGFDRENLVKAHMWYLIAEAQIAKRRNKVGKTLTPSLIIEAERRATEWLSRQRGIAPTSAEKSSPRPVLAAPARA